METKLNLENVVALSDIGLRRKNNEDAALSMTGKTGVLLLVADGMGGHRKGEVASGIVLESLREGYRKHALKFNPHSARAFLRKQFKEANKEIYRTSLSGDQFMEMGTTAVSCIITPKVTQVASIGDSRCYILDNNHQLVQITKDQSYVQMLFEAGKITREEMANHPQKNILTNSIGINPDLANLEEFTIDNGNYLSILLCSDGLFNMVSEEEITAVLCENLATSEKGKQLIDLALAHGGNDNVAVAIWEK